MNLIVWPIVGLLALFFLSHYTGYMLNMRKDIFFSPFHFTGGLLTALLSYGLTHSYALAVASTLGIGVAWEVYEVMVWKYVLKEKKYKPKDGDTRNDLLLDFIGSLTAIALIAYSSV